MDIGYRNDYLKQKNNERSVEDGALAFGLQNERKRV